MLKLINQSAFMCVLMLLAFSAKAMDKKREVDSRQLFKEEIKNNFDAFHDSLCFSNHSFTGHTGPNPYLIVLAKLADERGACQGMVGLASAFKSHVIFRATHQKMSKSKLQRQILRAVRLHHNACSGKVFIDGYKSIRDLCQSEADLLKRRSLTYNATLAISEILPKSGTFFIKGFLENPKKRNRHLLNELITIYEDLKAGHFPLMLVHDHVTLVTGLSVERDRDGYVQSLTLKHYDPNKIMSSEQDLFERVYLFSRDAQNISGTLIWNLTPRPTTHLGCAFIPKN